MEHVIVINKVQWNIVNAVTMVVERNGRQARVIFKNGKAKLFMRNILNGQFRSQRVQVA